MAEWVQTDDYQWLREIDDDYEMYQIMKAPEYVEREFWFAGGGRFSLSDYDSEDHEWALHSFGYEDMAEVERIYGDHAERVLAECLFECNWADFDIYSFGTLADAEAYCNKMMGD